MKIINLIFLVFLPAMLMSSVLFFYQNISSGIFELLAFILSANLLLIYGLIVAVVIFKMLRKKLALIGIEITTIFHQKSIAPFS